jgi:hypothetical protein
MEGHRYSLAAYIAGKESFTSNKHWTCLNLNLSRRKNFTGNRKKLTVLIVLKSGNLNLLEPSGPLQACNGIALPFTEKTWQTIRRPTLGHVTFLRKHEKHLFVKFYIFHSVHYNSVCTISTNRCTQLLYDSQCCK